MIYVEKMLLLHYKKLGLTDDEVLILLLTYTLIETGTPFINPNDLALFSNFSITKIDVIFSSLTTKGWILTVIDEHGHAKSSVQPLIEKLYDILFQQNKKEKNKETADNKEIYALFENFFARPLSPLEYDIINGWLKKGYTKQQIQAALDISKLNTNHSIRYIDTILFEEDKRKELSDEDYERRLQETIELSQIDWLNK